MPIPSKDRWASPSWKLDALEAATTHRQAVTYFQDFWDGWIAAPMVGPMAHGGWARLTLACLAVEACALFWKPLSEWRRLEWPMPGTGKPLVKSNDELSSTWAFCWVFREVFKGEEPQGIRIEVLAEVCYRVFRCGLAHRGLSKSKEPISDGGVTTKWLGVIDGQSEIFRNVGNASLGAVSVDPDKFAARLDHWFQCSVMAGLRARDPIVCLAFKEWCEDRWNIAASRWTDF